MFLERILFPVFCLFKVLPWVVSEEVEIAELAVDKGSNVTLPCGGLLVLPSPNVQWVHRGSRTHHEVLSDGSLFLYSIGVDDAGLYECSVENETAFADRVNLTVRTEPPPLVNVSVHATTILAVIMWNVAGDGGHPIDYFTAEYRSSTPVNDSLEPWRPISPNHISPNSRQIEVFHLDTNASYWFRVWATNALGPGPPTEVVATTLYIDQQAELERIFLEGSEGFDPRTWLAAVCVVMGTLAVLAAGTCAVLCREWRRNEGSEGFDPRTWLAAVCVVMGTLAVLAAGTCAVLCREWRRNDYDEDQDLMELVPNIILNPGFMETDPRPREQPSYAASIIKSTECPGPGKPRRV